MTLRNLKISRAGWIWICTIGFMVVSTVLTSCSSFNATPRQGWTRSNGPVVPHDKFPADCSICHEGGTWTKIKKDFTFDHEARTGVPLRGAHAAVACLMCHNDRGPVKVFADKGCAGCHTDPHRGQLGPTCTDCHQERSWAPVEQIAKHNKTRFPLVGAHASAACFTCHAGAQVGNFAGADPTCVTCHRDGLAKATSPNHVAQNLTTDCQRCHNPTGWKPAFFQHPAAFPLAAGHSGLECTQCHKGGVITVLSTACASCHLPEYQKTADPKHAAAGFSTDCKSCHTTSTWLSGKFANHSSAFPLSGGHASVSCSQCHKGGVFTALSTDCASCHLTDYQKANDPNHIAMGFGTDCKTCHTNARWEGAKFSHPAAFPLASGHANLSCSKCHSGGVYTGLSTSCSSCHLDDFQKTTDPNHTATGFSTNCKTCHSTAKWEGAKFTHTTAFPLTSGHANLTCVKCHSGGVFTGLSNSCSSCHLDDFQKTTDPNHTTSGFSTDCKTCHTTAQWQGAKFTHPAAFPLTNGHASLSCTKCHSGGVYTGLSTSCSSCHLDDFQKTKNPNHATSGFGTNCVSCHTTKTWQGAVFNHTFPITSGPHKLACTECHTNALNYKVFACTNCHEHRQSSMNSVHREVGGFSWTSPACFQCHPKGRGG